MDENNEIIQLVYQSGPVTALKVIDDILLAGIGSHLHIYELKTSQRIQVIQTLPHQNIHGISEAPSNGKSSNKLLCIFGGRAFQVVDFDEQAKRISKICQALEIRDWIWDAQWLKTAQDDSFDCLALVTGHNCIVRINWKSSQLLDRIQCEEQCILYCAHFIGLQWNQLILAAGTVFNQIILWAPTTNLTTNENLIISKPFHRLTGHQGVIFSIHYHEGLKKICSASDDRSIRVWQLHFAENSENGPNILDWQGVVSECIHVLYGHQARVWRAHLTSTGLASIGEDATCCIWDDEGKITQKFKGHKGKSIWSMAISKKEDLVVTGGGDSSIRVWSVHLNLCAKHVTSKQLEITHLEPEAKTPNFPRSVTYLNFNTILVMTNSGNLYQYCLIHSSWANLMEDPTFFSYSCLSVSNKTCTIAIGSLSGTIRLFQPSEQRSDDDCLCTCKYINCDFPNYYDGKVFNLLWIDDIYLFTTGPEGLMRLSILNSKGSSLGLEQLHQFILPQSKQRWATTACFYPAEEAEKESLVCGDRNGSVHLYSLQQDSQQVSTPKQSFYRIHGKSGVTDVRSRKGFLFTAGRDGQYRQFNSSEDNSLQLLNSKKVFKGFEWLDQLHFNDEDDLLILGFHSVNFLVWSCAKSQKMLEISCGGGHRGWGCQLRQDSARFAYIKARGVVICEAQIPSNQKVLKPSHHGRQQTNVKHLFSRIDSKGQIHHVCITCSDDTTVQVVELSNDHSKKMDLKVLLVLPGHISSVQTIVCLKTLTPPCWENGQSYLLFSAGGRAQFNCCRLTFLAPNNQDDDQTTVCIPEQLCTEFLVKRLPKHWAAKNLTVDPETRIMDLTAFHGQSVDPNFPQNIVFVGMACSDGSVRVFSFDEESRKLHCLWQSSAFSNCVLQVTHFVHSSNNTAPCRIFLLSAATDGYIHFWEITSICHSQLVTNSREILCTPENETVNDFTTVEADSLQTLATASTDNTEESHDRKRVGTLLTNGLSSDCKEESDFNISANMSGINSLHIKQFPDGSLILGTGGDDNAFFVMSFLLSPPDSAKEDKLINCQFSLKNQFGHAAQITGIHVMNKEFIVTSSIDQRICLWHLQLCDAEKKYVCVLCRYVEVADLSSMEVWMYSNHLYIAVCGAGLCVLSIDLQYFDGGNTGRENGFLTTPRTSTHLLRCP